MEVKFENDEMKTRLRVDTFSGGKGILFGYFH